MPDVCSRVRLFTGADDHLTFDFATAQPGYSAQGERVTDRLGLVHRIAPAVVRHPTALSLALVPEELTRLACATAVPRLCAVDWLERAFTQQQRLAVFVLGATLAADGSAIARRLAYQGYLEELPGAGFGTLPGWLETAESAELRLLITAAGGFTDFDDMASASYLERNLPQLDNLA